MKRTIWHIVLLIVFGLSIGSPVLAIDCKAVKQDFKQEHNLKKKQIMIAVAIKQCPDDPDINYKYALNLERFRKYEDALRYYRKAVQFNPDMAMAHAGIGDVCTHLGLLDEAIAAYDKAVKYMPGNKRYEGRYIRLLIKKKALRGEVLAVGDFIKVMDSRKKISTAKSLLLTGPALQYCIAFVGSSAILRITGVKQLAAVGKAMQNESILQARFEISTHVSTDLSPLAALEDSRERANTIKDHLVNNYGIDPKRLELRWYADDHPLDTEEVDGAVAANERVEFKRIIE